jgi:hypothetical protein
LHIFGRPWACRRPMELGHRLRNEFDAQHPAAAPDHFAGPSLLVSQNERKIEANQTIRRCDRAPSRFGLGRPPSCAAVMKTRLDGWLWRIASHRPPYCQRAQVGGPSAPSESEAAMTARVPEPTRPSPLARPGPPAAREPELARQPEPTHYRQAIS